VFRSSFGLVTMSSIGLPMLNASSASSYPARRLLSPPLVPVVAASEVVCGGYMLGSSARDVGRSHNPENRKLIDLDLREKVVLVAISFRSSEWRESDPLLPRIEPSVSACSRLPARARAAAPAQPARVPRPPRAPEPASSTLRLGPSPVRHGACSC